MLRFLVAALTGLIVPQAWAHPADGACSSNLLTVPFLAVSGSTLENLDVVHPMGNIFGVHPWPTSHFYLSLQRDCPAPCPEPWNAPSLLTTVRAPGPSKLLMVYRHTDDPGSVTAYEVTLKVCENTYIYIDHLNTLSPAITAVTGTIAPDSAWIDLSMSLELAAGDALGTTTSTHALDIGAYDTTYSAPYVSPTLYWPNYPAIATEMGITVEQAKSVRPSQAHKRCAMRYFTSTAAALLNSYNQRTNSDPSEEVGRCGVFAQDIADRAQGTWWPAELPVPLDEGLQEHQTVNLTRDSVDWSYGAFSFGADVPLANADGTAVVSSSVGPIDWYFDEYAAPVSYWDRINWKFSDIQDGWETYCYRDLRETPWGSPVSNRILLVQMVTTTYFGQTKRFLRMQARTRSDCPAVWDRHLDNFDGSGNRLTGNFVRN